MQITELHNLFLQHPQVQTDTRKLQAGQLFFALKGDNFDANTFAQQALDIGAAAVIIDNKDYYINDKTIVVDDVLTTLQALAKHHRQQFSIPFLAITGSNGKTTTKELLAAVLQKKYKTYYTAGNLNNHIGVPLTLLSIQADAEFAIIEMGANHQQEIAGYCQYAMPTHVLINNCGKAHLEGFGGIEGVYKGKGELYDYAAAHNCVVFRNADLDYLQTMAQARNIINEITYGSGAANYLGKPMLNNGLIDVAIITPGLETIIKTQLVGDYNFANIIGAVAVARTFDVSMQDISDALFAYTPSNSRSQLIQQGSTTIILDAYNANPTSMRLAITNFANTSYPNKIVMIGGMKELGEYSLQEHQDIITQLQQSNWNDVVLVGGDFANVQHNYHYFATSTDAKTWLAIRDKNNTAILIKGSRATAMEKVLEA
jgi:UDP-N-acetylmuramoyl-tripeptide--D-alanyl-D-alanine ligase